MLLNSTNTDLFNIESDLTIIKIVIFSGLYVLVFSALVQISVGYTCQQEGYTYPDEINCRNYFICRNGNPVKLTCPTLLYWNCHNSTCARMKRGECCPQDNKMNVLGLTVPCINGVKIPAPRYCNKYFLCQNASFTAYYCPSGQRFDPVLMKCRTAWLGNCATPKPTQSTSTTTTNAPSSGTTSSTNINSTSWKIPDIFNCNKYYTFENRRLVQKVCPNDTYYNCWQRNCSSNRSALCCTSLPYLSGSKSCPTNGVNNSVPLSCMSYYECINNKVVRKRCPSFQAYDSWTGTCKSPITARCSIKPGLTVCEASSGGSLPFASVNFNVSVVCPKW